MHGEFVMNLVGFCAGAAPLGPCVTSPYAHWSAMVVITPASLHYSFVISSCHDDAVFGCSCITNLEFCAFEVWVF